MLEKEVKILEINVLEIQNQLESFGAIITFEGYIHDIYYDFKDEDTSVLKMEANQRLFRVRKKGEVHMYTIKRKREKKFEGGEKGLKIADEGEREITNVDSFKKVLEKYGMKEIREKKKYRVSYALEGCEFDIDNYLLGDDKNIPPLLEIEAKTFQDINYWIDKLGLENHKRKTWGSRKLFEHYGVEYNWL